MTWQQWFEERFDELESAEDFLEAFALDYDRQRVCVCRLHILQRFHDYLAAAPIPADPESAWARARALLKQAHDDLLASDPKEEAVLGVYRRVRQGPQPVAIPVATIGRRGRA